MGCFKILKNKVIILTIIVILANFIMPTPVRAESKQDKKGGKLLEPICDFVIFVRRCCNKYIAK